MSTVRVRAFAKINLDLRVLGKRADGYHELRTIFQTISLSDTIDICFKPARITSIACEDTWSIPGNLAARAAAMVMDTPGRRGRVEIRITKRIPMGAGLGGGSSDAAAILLALPALAGRRIELSKLREMAQELGSDVPFFLLGGTAVGIGRGTELFPMPDMPASAGLLITPDVHVSTAQAYRDLSARLTNETPKLSSFQDVVWNAGAPWQNDFESVVFEQHPELARVKKRLLRAGAPVALMTGSGSAILGLFPDRASLANAAKTLANLRPRRFSLVSRARYRRSFLARA